MCATLGGGERRPVKKVSAELQTMVSANQIELNGIRLHKSWMASFLICKWWYQSLPNIGYWLITIFQTSFPRHMLPVHLMLRAPKRVLNAFYNPVRHFLQSISIWFQFRQRRRPPCDCWGFCHCLSKKLLPLPLSSPSSVANSGSESEIPFSALSVDTKQVNVRTATL